MVAQTRKNESVETQSSLALYASALHIIRDGRCGLRERHLSTGPYYSLGSWLCSDRGSFNSGAHLKTEVHEDLLASTGIVVAVTFYWQCAAKFPVIMIMHSH